MCQKRRAHRCNASRARLDVLLIESDLTETTPLVDNDNPPVTTGFWFRRIASIVKASPPAFRCAHWRQVRRGNIVEEKSTLTRKFELNTEADSVPASSDRERFFETDEALAQAAVSLKALGRPAQRLLGECVEHQELLRKKVSPTFQALESLGFVFVRSRGTVFDPLFAICPSLAGEEVLEALEHESNQKPAK